MGSSAQGDNAESAALESGATGGGEHQTGLRDAHLHLVAHGEELSAVALADCASVEECLRRVAARAGETEAGGWIVARGARVEAWRERRYPSAAELDDAGGGRPVLVASFDHHAGAGSRAALRAAGIGAGAGDAPGGVVERDGRGQPTGLVLEGAFKTLCRAMPGATDEQVRGHVRTAQRDLMGMGFVEVHDMMTTAREASVLCAMEEAGEIALEVVCYAIAEEFDGVRARLVEHSARMGAGARVRFGGLKLFTDGTLNSRTAHMLRPYADPIREHPCGTPLMTRAEIEAAFGRAGEEGFDVAAHAIGDGAVRGLLDVYEGFCGRGRRTMPGRAGHGSPGLGGRQGFGLRIEHAQFVDGADVGRFGALGVVASVQPCHLLTDIEAIERLVPDRAGRAFPLRELIDGAGEAGLDPREMVLLGSDTPIVPPTPSDNVQAAVHRRRDDPACPVIGGGQAITEGQAWSLMRAGSAR